MAYRRLGGVYQAFILNPMHPPRRHAIEMGHKLKVVSVVEAKVFEVVAIYLALSKVLFE